MPRSYYGSYPGIARAAEGAQDYSSAVTGGFELGSSLVDAFLKAQQQHRMDVIANQIQNTQAPPRAALVGQGTVPTATWDDPATWAALRQKGLGTTGTAPASGGVLELQMRQAQSAIEAKAQQQALEDAYKRAQIADLVAKAAGKGYYSKDLTPAQQLAEQHRQWQEDEKTRANILAQAKAQQTAATDTPQKVLKDFNALYPGKTTDPNTDTSLTQGEAVYNALNQGTGARGNVVNGQFIGDPNGDYFTWQGDAHGKPASQVPKVKWDALQPFIQRLDKITQAGGSIVPPMVARALPVRGQPPPTSGAPTAAPGAGLPTPQTQDDYDAIPSGSQFVDVDGITKTKY